MASPQTNNTTAPVSGQEQEQVSPGAAKSSSPFSNVFSGFNLFGSSKTPIEQLKDATKTYFTALDKFPTDQTTITKISEIKDKIKGFPGLETIEASKGGKRKTRGGKSKKSKTKRQQK